MFLFSHVDVSVDVARCTDVSPHGDERTRHMANRMTLCAHVSVCVRVCACVISG